jgi:hsp70-interacting protein
LGILATMCQNNPPVQAELLSLGSIRILTEIYFAEYPQDTLTEPPEESNGQVRAKTVQAMSANVRNNATAEDVFYQVQEARGVIASALGLFSGHETLPPPPASLRKRALFFLRALITSDTSTMTRVRKFNECICFACDNLVSDQDDADDELREMSLGMIQQILTQRYSVNAVLSRKETLVATGVRRVAAIRELQREERDYANIELESWELVLVLLSRAEPDDELGAATAMIEGSKTGNIQTLAQ